MLEALLESTKEAGSVCTSEAGTNTQEDVVGRAMLQLTSVDQRYASKRSHSTSDSVMAAKLSDMHRDSEERVKVQVAAQVVNHAVSNNVTLVSMLCTSLTPDTPRGPAAERTEALLFSGGESP